MVRSHRHHLPQNPAGGRVAVRVGIPLLRVVCAAGGEKSYGGSVSLRATKKSVVREYLERIRPARVGAEEAAAIRRELARVLGPQARISEEYLLEVLQELGANVVPELGGVSPQILELLRFDTLEAAEATLRALDERYRESRQRDDRGAAEECRRAAMRVRRRSAMIAGNRKVSAAKRAEKEEIAQWFSIWLQTPDVFFDWLALRKQSEDFRQKFGPHSEADSR